MKKSLLFTYKTHKQNGSWRLMASLAVLFLLVLPLQAFAQTSGKVSGVVSDASGEPIPGATVVLLGGNAATMTDGDGKFTITATSGKDLKISSIGYLTKTVKTPESAAQLKIVMQEESKNLKEVIAIGYGSVKRENVLGAVSSIVGKEIEDIPAGNMSQAVVGKLASVRISETSGKPGSSTPLTIRTSGSFNSQSSEPIFVIDGIIKSQSAFDMLDPTQVESISVLKDAAATVYGARGSGGAIIVTLKKGKEGKAKLTYSGQFGYKMPTRFPDMLSAADQARLINIYNYKSDLYTNEDILSDNRYYTDSEIEQMKSLDYNWLDAAWQNSYQSRNTVSLSGGTDKVRYLVGGSLFNENGNFANIDLKQFSLRSSLDADLTDEITASFEISVSNKTTMDPFMQGDNEDNMKGMYKTLLTTPYWIPYKVDDNYVQSADGVQNPLALLESDCYKSSFNYSTQLNAGIQYKPKWIPGLTANFRLGVSNSFNASRQYATKYQIWEYGFLGEHNHLIDTSNPTGVNWMNTGDNERLSLSYGKGNSYQLNAGLTYFKSIGKHNLGAFLNYEQSENESDGMNARTIGQLVPNKEIFAYFRALDLYANSLSSSGRFAFIGRFNYDYDGKYLLETTFREDVSVKFAPGHRWAFFPQAALGWRISEENFFKNNIDLVNYLKLRGSVGLVGNDGAVGAYEYQLAYNIAEAAHFGPDNTDQRVETGLKALHNSIQTRGVTWEKTMSYNLGMDSQWWEGMFNFSVDGFYRHTWDIFDRVSATLTDLFGIPSNSSDVPKINYGIEDSWGLECELGYNGRVNDDFSYSISANWNWGENKIIRKLQDSQFKNTYKWEEGKSTNQGEEGFIVTGMIRTQEQLDAYKAEHPGMTFFGDAPALGMLIFEDIARAGVASRGEPKFVNEPDGIVDQYDITWIGGKTGPTHAFGLNLSATYKALRADLGLVGGFGGVGIMNKDERVGPTSTMNVPSYWTDSWTYANPNATYPSVIHKTQNSQASTFWIRSSSILRLRSFNLSYNLPKEVSMRIGIPYIRVMLTGTNLLTLLSDYDYKDANLTRFYDYPLMRSFNLGINLGF